VTQEHKTNERNGKLTMTGWLMALAACIGVPAFAQDSAVWRASTKYANPAPLRAILLGANYRQEWRTPVSLPVFHLSQQGFTIKELGGGQQTISLQLIDGNGRGWSLRSVDKDVTKALPPGLRNTPVKGLVQDLVSGAHPYIPLAIPTLSKAAGVIAPVPTIYFVPDDPAFGEYRSLFANTLCLLEEREPTPDKSDTKNTEKLLEKIFESQAVRVDQKALLRARILDMFIGDWDRHSDQWRWGIRDSGKLSVYYPIPRDRDQAFFYSEGLLVKFVQLMALRHLVSFDDDLAKVKSLNYKMWPFDMLLLNGLDRQQWTATLTELQAAFTDEVIHEAVSHLPPEIYAIRGARIEKKLRERRQGLVKQGLRYYHFIAARVDVYGTNAEELFDVAGDGNDVVVKVFAMKSGTRAGLLYERRFTKGDTDLVRLFGLRGNDSFVVAENVKSRIRIELHGEDGTDSYATGSGRVTIVDENGEAKAK
jgi:hypothetical protein